MFLTCLCCYLSFVGMGLSRGQHHGKNERSVDYSNYGSNYGSNYDGYDTGPEHISCYLCFSQVSDEDVTGDETCIDPFDPTGIPTHKCTDGDCAISSHTYISAYYFG